MPFWLLMRPKICLTYRTFIHWNHSWFHIAKKWMKPKPKFTPKSEKASRSEKASWFFHFLKFFLCNFVSLICTKLCTYSIYDLQDIQSITKKHIPPVFQPFVFHVHLPNCLRYNKSIYIFLRPFLKSFQFEQEFFTFGDEISWYMQKR